MKTVVLKNKEDFYHLLPKLVQNAVAGSNGFLAGVMSPEEKLMGIGAFSFSKTHEEDVNMEYLFVPPEHRENGVSTQMLDDISDLLRKEGVKTIMCSLVGEVEYLMPLYEYLQAQDFVAVKLMGHFTEYRLSDLLKCEAFKPLRTIRTSSVKSAEEIDKQRLRGFLNTLYLNEVLNSERNFNPQLSRFYLKNSEIVGCVLVLPETTNGITIFWEYVNEAAGESLAIPAMLADFADAAKEHFDEETPIVLVLDDYRLHDALCEVLGSPTQDNYYQQYCRYL